MLEVRWRHAALEELASLWVAATSEDRELISAAVDEIDRALARNPIFGESRSGSGRIGFLSPWGFSSTFRPRTPSCMFPTSGGSDRAAGNNP
jgi:hypothetical protein